MSHQEAYRVGDLLAYQANDPVFTGAQAYAQALAQAFAWSVTHADTPYGVWNALHADMPYGMWATPDDGSELLAIVHNGEVFTK